MDREEKMEQPRHGFFMLNERSRIKPSLRAAGLWFLMIFGLGFVLGTLRVLGTSPRLGELAAVALEVPVMLAAGWLSCRWLIRREGVAADRGARTVMALGFLGLLGAAELLLGRYGFGQGMAAQLAVLQTPAGALGLMAQGVTASFPLWGRRKG
jgi:hypothetical protein